MARSPRRSYPAVAVWPERLTAAGDAFLAEMLPDLLGWNTLDLPDDRERDRSSWIASRQGTENPFVLDPTLARRAFSPQTVAAEAPPEAALSVLVYPNPTTDHATVVLTRPAPAETSVDLVDVLGRVVARAESRADRIALDLAGLPAGLYVVRVQTPTGTAHRLLSVAH